MTQTQWGLAVFLELAGMLAAFIAAWRMLAHGRLERYPEGLRLGLWTALGFYFMWVLLFGVIPAFAGLEQGRLVDSLFYFA